MGQVDGRLSAVGHWVDRRSGGDAGWSSFPHCARRRPRSGCWRVDDGGFWRKYKILSCVYNAVRRIVSFIPVRHGRVRYIFFGIFLVLKIKRVYRYRKYKPTGAGGVNNGQISTNNVLKNSLKIWIFGEKDSNQNATIQNHFSLPTRDVWKDTYVKLRESNTEWLIQLILSVFIFIFPNITSC